MQSGKIWNRQFIRIFTVSIVFNLGQCMVNALLPKYADSLGCPASQIGFLMSSFAVTALVFRFLAGPFMDFVRRKYLLICAMTFMAIAYLGFGASDSIYALIAFRLLQGISIVFGNACCLAMSADLLPKDQFTAGVSYHSCAMAAAQAIGPSIGLQFVEHFPYKNAFFMNAGLMVLAVMIVMWTKLPPQERKSFRWSGKNMFVREALLSIVILFFTSSGFAVIKSLLIVYAGKRGIDSGIGVFFIIHAVTLLVSRPVISKLIDQHGFVKLVIPALCMSAVSLLMLSLADELWIFWAAAVIDAFGYSAVLPALQSLCLKSVPLERRGSASSLTYIGLDGATMMMPLLAGVLTDWAGYSAMWISMIIPIFIGIGIIFFHRRQIKEIEDKFAAD